MQDRLDGLTSSGPSLGPRSTTPARKQCATQTATPSHRSPTMMAESSCARRSATTSQASRSAPKHCGLQRTDHAPGPTRAAPDRAPMPSSPSARYRHFFLMAIRSESRSRFVSVEDRLTDGGRDRSMSCWCRKSIPVRADARWRQRPWRRPRQSRYGTSMAAVAPRIVTTARDAEGQFFGPDVSAVPQCRHTGVRRCLLPRDQNS